MAVLPSANKQVYLEVRLDGTAYPSSTPTGVFLSGPALDVDRLLDRMRNGRVITGLPERPRYPRYCGDQDDD